MPTRKVWCPTHNHHSSEEFAGAARDRREKRHAKAPHTNRKTNWLDIPAGIHIGKS